MGIKGYIDTFFLTSFLFVHYNLCVAGRFSGAWRQTAAA